MSSAIKKWLWPLVAEIAEERAQAIVEDYVREMNEEVKQYIAGDGAVMLDKLLDGVPAEFAIIIESIVVEYVTTAVAEIVQKNVDKAWAEIEKINAGDKPEPSPKVDFSGE